MDQKPPDRVGGCLATVVGAAFTLIGSLFLVVTVLDQLGVIRVQKNGPAWFFLVFPVPFVVAGVFMLRFGWSNLTRPRPPAPPAPDVPPGVARAAFPVLVGFGLTAALSFAGVVVAQFAFNAPGWVAPVVFFAPPAVFTAVMWPTLRTLGERMKRAAPSPESLSVAAPAAGAAAPDAPKPVPMAGDLPTVPEGTTTPGKVLAHALDRDGMPAGCMFGCAVGVAIFWNGIVSVFLWELAKGFQRGRPDWFMALFLVPFVLVGLGMVAFTLYSGLRWVVSLLVGRVEVEVTNHPLTPGGRYELHAAQRGMFRLGGVAAELVCEEVATYVAGTSKNTAKRVVARHPVSDPDRDGRAVPLSAAFAVPAEVMHSFQAPNNEIEWRVRLTGRVLGVLPYSDDFAVVVRPATVV
ncbi:MAG TPA: hypothetical protein VD866_17940 [Urbifossiella sp.]|nr:hypothetical protein [Urbifossiella sp.]